MVSNPPAIQRFLKAHHLLVIDQQSLDEVWHMHSRLQMLKTMLVNDGLTEFKEYVLLDAMLETTNQYYLFLCAIRTAVSATDFSKLARTLQTSGQLLETTAGIMADGLNIPSLLVEGLSRVLDYLSGTAFISGGLDGCESVMSAHSVAAYDLYWSLFQELETRNKAQITAFATQLDSIFKSVMDRRTPLGNRIVSLALLYRIVYAVYMVTFYRQLDHHTDDGTMIELH